MRFGPSRRDPSHEASHAIQPIELFGGQTIEITETANDATFHELCEQLLANALKVKRAATNRVAQRLEVLCWAGTVWTAVAHLVAHNFGVALMDSALAW